jgi:hypothetical protein
MAKQVWRVGRVVLLGLCLSVMLTSARVSAQPVTREDVKAAAGTALQWLFAEGSQGFFFTYFLLVNPQTAANTARVTYLRENAPPLVLTYTVRPLSRLTVDAGSEPDLRDRSFGALIEFDALTVRFLRTSGAPIVKQFTVAPTSRFNAAVAGPRSEVPELANEAFGAVIESTQPIAVERSLYSTVGGLVWAAGTNATATRLP